MDIFALSMIILAASGGRMRAQKAKEARARDEAANEVVAAWLALIDDGKYDDAWDSAAVLLRPPGLMRADWQQSVSSARARWGALHSRRLRFRDPATSRPGLPDGEYIVFDYDVTCANGVAAEKVVVAPEHGVWRVASYAFK